MLRRTLETTEDDGKIELCQLHAPAADGHPRGHEGGRAPVCGNERRRRGGSRQGRAAGRHASRRPHDHEEEGADGRRAAGVRQVVAPIFHGLNLAVAGLGQTLASPRDQLQI